MTVQLTRRDFMRALVIGAGAVALPLELIEEPRKRIWQVGAQLGQPLTLTRSSWVPGLWPLDARADDHSTHVRAHKALAEQITFNPPAPESELRAFIDHGVVLTTPWSATWITGIESGLEALAGHG